MPRKVINRLYKLRFLIVVLLAVVAAPSASSVSFDLDSIAAWGKFPKFCIGVYRWGDKFFNTYDTTYVQGTGTKFNVKITADSWLDYYRFVLPGEGEGYQNRYADLISRPSTSIGVHLTYLAVSVGYDINISSFIHGVKEARQRYQFGFNCALFSAEAYKETSNVGTKITRWGNLKHLSIPYNGMHSSSWGIDAYYFFNNKRYSEAAAFNYSRIQRQSQGSFYAGLSVYSQSYDFDFSHLDSYIRDRIPEEWEENHFITKTQNYGFRVGYGYNWVFAKHWVLGASISPTIGIKHGYTNSSVTKTGFSLYNHIKGSIVWNGGRWFAGVIGYANTAVVSDRQTTLLGNTLSVTAAVGYRFNLW